MYDLFTDGVRDIGRSLIFRKQKVSREPLVGTVDGINTVFFTPTSPLLSSDTTHLYSSGSVIDTSSYELDIDTGCFVLTTAPSVQLVATYVLVDISSEQLKSCLIAGFQNLESQLNQGWLLSSGSIVYSQSTGDEDNAYVVDSDMQDPTIGSTTFSTSLVCKSALMCAVEISLLNSRMTDASHSSFSYREDRGISVDKSRVPQNIMLQIQNKNKELQDKLIDVEKQLYGDDAMGGYIGNPVSDDYTNNFSWRDE